MFSGALAFLFEKTAGKGLAIAALLAALFGWWQWDRAAQRQIGAAMAQAAEARKETELIHDHLEQADRVRTDAERAARGERMRNIRPDPYFERPRPGG